MKTIITVVTLATLYLMLTTSIFAESKILINEFLIDPQPQSVEIFNYGSESADISDWVIDDSGGTTFYTIPKENIIFPNQCLVYSTDFNLNKTSADTVRLFNNHQQLIDSFSYKASSGSGISFVRLPDGENNWTTASANLGFYNSSREQACLFPTPTLIPTLTPTPSPTQPTPTAKLDVSITPTLPTGTGNPTPTSPAVVLTEAPKPTAEVDTTPTSTSIPIDNIYLSEVMTNPPSSEKEWVEIYNNNDFTVSLDNWYIDDLENAGSSPKIFSLLISPKSYGVYDLTSSMFNNDGDNVRLLDFNKNLKDDFEYQKSEQGKTLGRISFESDDFCLQEPSKNLTNNSCINLTPTVETPKLSVSTNSSPTPNIFQSKIAKFTIQTPANKLISNHVSIYKNVSTPVETTSNGQVLGTSDEIIFKPSNNKSLINLLCFLSSFYSLLTIGTILFRMKILYGKNHKFYSSSFCSP